MQGVKNDVQICLAPLVCFSPFGQLIFLWFSAETPVTWKHEVFAIPTGVSSDAMSKDVPERWANSCVVRARGACRVL